MALNNISVAVVYASVVEQVILALDIPVGTTVREAIERSHILKQFPEINLHTNQVGIFGKVIALDHILQANDRIEIYRPLLIDPKQARRKRVVPRVK